MDPVGRQPFISFQDNIAWTNHTELNVETVTSAERVTDLTWKEKEGSDENVTSEALNNLISECLHTVFFC